MKVKLKKKIKQEIIDYLKDNNINPDDVDHITLSKEEIQRAVREGSLSYELHTMSHLSYDVIKRYIQIESTFIQIKGDSDET